MTENQQEVIVADVDAIEAVEAVVPEIESIAENHADNDSDEEDTGESGEGSGDQFPKKAVNALNRKTKTIAKLRAKLQELEAKHAQLNTVEEIKPVNSDEFDTLDAYLDAKMDALVKTQIKQTDTERQKAQITQEQQALLYERDMYVKQQAAEMAKAFPDLPQVWQQNSTALDGLPKEVADIFYSLENTAAAVYVLGKEGQIDALRYANPYVAANMIMSAEQRGKQLLSRMSQPVNNAPEPMKGAKGVSTSTKNLMQGSVLKNLGLKS